MAYTAIASWIEPRTNLGRRGAVGCGQQSPLARARRVPRMCGKADAQRGTPRVPFPISSHNHARARCLAHGHKRGDAAQATEYARA